MTLPDDISPASIIKHILDSQNLAALASVAGNRPYSNLVAFAASDDLKYLFFVTGRNTRKYANIMSNPGVSLLVDSRTGQLVDFTAAYALTVLGAAAEVTAGELDYTADVYRHKHPNLEAFLETLDNALMQVKVTEYILAGFHRPPQVVIP
jgi:nitroimidazol reductase NimA-like FMN-containing flavoprotein (pyridoxamine 5'-phosphate oxidase superfamily)